MVGHVMASDTGPGMMANVKRSGPDNGIFLMEFPVFAQCFPIVTIVGPIDLSTRQTSRQEDDWPDCIYRSKPESLFRVKTLLDAIDKT